MPLTLPPPLPTREDGLTRRLDDIAARLRRVVVVRAASWLVLLSLVVLGGLAFIDYRYQLPSLVRALGLVAYLVAVPLLVRRWIVRPLAGSDDRQAVALRVERAYPEFNDSLVSAVEFMGRGPDDRTTSVAFRKMAIRRAARKAERYEFDRAVDARGLNRSMFAALVAVGGRRVARYVRPPTRRGRLSNALPCRSAARRRRPRRRSRSSRPKPLPHRMARGEPLDLKLGASRARPGPGDGVGETRWLAGLRAGVRRFAVGVGARRGRVDGPDRANSHPARLPVPGPGQRR